MLDRERGPGIMLVVAVAMAGLFLTRPEPASPAAAPPEHHSDAPPSQPTPPSASQCLAGNEPVRFLCRFFGDSSVPAPQDKDWRSLPWVELVRGQQVTFLVATVPDPELTRLALYFDRSLASIQAAAASDRWRFDRIWLPWKTSAAATAGVEDQAAESLPGVMLFRGGSGQAAVVFLIGESPVAGIRRAAFREAMDIIQALSPKPPLEVRIAGPNFSGSFPSLRQEIDAVACKPEWKAVFRVLSPNTTVTRAQQSFTSGEAVGQIRFSRLLSGDDGTLAAFYGYLEAHWGAGIPTAFVAEGETVYGLQTSKDDRAAKPFNFPREIALLRNLYPEAARHTFGAPGAAPSGATDLKLRSGGRPALPVFAEQHTVASYEAQLLQIAQALHHDGFQMAGLAATDILDMIYVAGYLRRASPETRLFLLDADLLLVRATSSYALDGTLLLTDFPLVLENRVWTGWPDRTPYSSRWEMAVFNAVRALLLEGRPNPEPLLEYADPFNPAAGSPPVWLTIVSHDRLWPIATIRESSSDGRLLWKPGEAKSGDLLRVAQPTLAWRVLTALLSFAALAFAGLIILACSRSARRSAEGLEMYCFDASGCGRAGRAFYLLAMAQLLAAMLLVQITPVLAVEQFRADFGLHLILPVLALAALVLVAAGILIRAGRCFLEPPASHEVETPQLRKAFGLLTIGAFATFLLFLIVWTICFRWSSPGAAGESYFRAYRSLSLFSGVSPVLPVLILCFSLFLLVLVHFRRYAMFVREHPFLPAASTDPFLARIQYDEDPLLRLISWPVLGRKDAPFAFLGLLVLPLALRGPQSIESYAFDLLYIAMLVASVVLSMQVWLRFLLMWREIHSVLESLEAHPIRETFNALPPEFSEIPLFGGAGRYRTSIVFCRLLDVLRALETAHRIPPSVLYATEHSQLASLTSKLRLYLGPDADVPAEAMASQRSLDHEFCLVASRLFEKLSPHWSAGRSAREGAGAALPAEDWIPLAAEFIALRYAAYIRYVMLQLRNLLGFLTGGFFLTVVSALVYPFRSQHLLGWIATASLLALGVPILLALLQMGRDPLLARLRSKDSTAGSFRFLLRAALYALPALIAVAGTHFPGLSRFFGNWMAPALQALSK